MDIGHCERDVESVARSRPPARLRRLSKQISHSGLEATPSFGCEPSKSQTNCLRRMLAVDCQVFCSQSQSK